MTDQELTELRELFEVEIKSGNPECHLNLQNNTRFMELFEKASYDEYEHRQNTLYKTQYHNHLDSSDMLLLINKVWGEVLVPMEMLYVYLWDQIVKYRNAVDPTKSKQFQYVFKALDHNVGRGFQVYMEIVCLMKNGFPDGAYARWRTLNEICVVSDFIAGNGEEVAEEYCNSNMNSNEWARRSECFKDRKKTNRITTKALFENSNYNNEFWYKQFKDASFAIHAHNIGTLSSLSKPGAFANKTAPGETIFGLETAAMKAPNSLCNLVNTYFLLSPNIENIVVVSCANMWAQHICKLTEIINEFIREHYPESQK